MSASGQKRAGRPSRGGGSLTSFEPARLIDHRRLIELDHQKFDDLVADISGAMAFFSFSVPLRLLILD